MIKYRFDELNSSFKIQQVPQGSPTPPSSALKLKGLGATTLRKIATRQKDCLDSKVIVQGKYKCKRKIVSITEDTMATSMPTEEMVNMLETSFLALLIKNWQTNPRKCMGLLNDPAKTGGGHLRKAGTG